MIIMVDVVLIDLGELCVGSYDLGDYKSCYLMLLCSYVIWQEWENLVVGGQLHNIQYRIQQLHLWYLSIKFCSLQRTGFILRPTKEWAKPCQKQQYGIGIIVLWMQINVIYSEQQGGGINSVVESLLLE